MLPVEVNLRDCHNDRVGARRPDRNIIQGPAVFPPNQCGTTRTSVIAIKAAARATTHSISVLPIERAPDPQR